MSELRFDDRIAVVTGAGRGLGRSYALLLASRGAKVIVNDAGVDAEGHRTADRVVEEIRAAGGRAVACTESVATAEGGRAIIDAALEHYGGIDILIHNAGVTRAASLKEMSSEDFDIVLDVHLRGGFHVVRPAFPLMCEAGYGRVVLVSSILGLYGMSGRANYAAAKAGLVGLSGVVAVEGAGEGVKCNVLLPGARTEATDAAGWDMQSFPPMGPELVAPTAGWLAHESCSISGEMLVSIAGRLARAFVAESRGIYRHEWTVEDVAQQIDVIRDAGTSCFTAQVVPSGYDEHMSYSFSMASDTGTTEISSALPFSTDNPFPED